MEEEKEQVPTFEVTTPVASMKSRGKQTAELITALSLTVTGVLTYAVWQHDQHTRDVQSQVAALVKEATQAQKEMAQAQRLMTCVVLEERNAAYLFPICKNLGKIP